MAVFDVLMGYPTAYPRRPRFLPFHTTETRPRPTRMGTRKLAPKPRAYASEVRAHLEHELAILRRRPLDRDRARHAGRDLRRGRLALGRLRRVRRASPPTRRRTLDVLYSLNPRRDLTPHPPARAGFPRGGPENRGRHGRPLRAAGGRRALGRHQVHVHPVRRPPGRGQEGAFSSPSSRNRETSFFGSRDMHEDDHREKNRPATRKRNASSLIKT